MQLSIRTIVEFYALAAGLILAFACIGLPLKIALSALNRDVSAAVSTPVLGMVTAVVVGWWWYTPFGKLGSMPRALTLIGVVIAALILLVPVIRRRVDVLPANPRATFDRRR